MNILFIFPVFPEDINTSSLVKDLTSKFAKQHNVYIATPREKKFGLNTKLQVYNHTQILRVKTGNLFDTVNKFNKLVTTFTMPREILSSIKTYWKDIKFDLIITQTPYTSNALLINGLKSYYQCPALLILFDLFPQNAKDIGLIKNKILFDFFKYKEKKMLLSFDYIGCMSKGNIEYVKNNYPYIKFSTLFLLPLWGSTNATQLSTPREEIRKKYGFKNNDFILIFGGNLGKPQKIDNIMKLAKSCKDDNQVKFLFVGKGTEANRIKNIIKSEKMNNNIIFINYIPREDYEDMTKASDVGLISLDERFTVPNFPSKTIDYTKFGLPILASLDNCSTNDYGKLIQNDFMCGLYSQAGDTNTFKENLYKIKNDIELRNKFKENGKHAFINHFNVKNAYQNIINKVLEND
jgi:glycosyltransferase involved in cell wall biosynthesis